MDTLSKLVGYEGLRTIDPKSSSKTPQPKRKFSEDIEKKIEPLKDKGVYIIGVLFLN
jgi:hypothetical protein